MISVLFVGCGDAPGYIIVVDNRTSAPILVGADGLDDGVVRPNEVRFTIPGESRAALPFIRLDLGANGHPSGGITWYDNGCEPIATATAGMGTWLVTVTDAGMDVAPGEMEPDLPAAARQLCP